jgi:hypothetical protein
MRAARTGLSRPPLKSTLGAMHSGHHRSVLGLIEASVVAALACMALGCGPRWTVIQQAVPDPFFNQRQFFIEGVHTERLFVGELSEPVYLSGKTPEQQASWQSDKQDMAARYSEGLISEAEGLVFPTQPTPSTFIVRPIVDSVEPGFYAFVASHPTEVEMRVELVALNGQVLDAIHIRSVIGASMVNAASGTRMRQAAEDLGRVTAEYLKTRVFR